MQDTTKYVGLDVHKEKIAIAVADEGREEPRYVGTMVHNKDAVRKLVNQLGVEGVTLKVCYEAGPTGYQLYRWFLEMGVDCTVIAPSLIPKRSGDRVKTDKKDALRLAKLFRAGELISVYVPTPEDEALRDLVRAREDVKEDLNRSKQRLGKFLLRHHLNPSAGIKPWTQAYEAWLDTLRFTDECLRLTFQEYRQSIFEAQERMKRLEKEIRNQAQTGHQAPLVQALQGLRGIRELTAVTLASEIGNIGSRFLHPKFLMSYSGLVPSENSSGDRRWQGRITKAGNSHIRRVLTEAAWSYRYSPAVRITMRRRLNGLSPAIQAISWKAQNRLHKKYKMMLHRNKHKGAIAAAIARELAGFVWAIATEFEKEKARRSLSS